MVIAAVARQRGGVEVAGKEEFRARLGQMTDQRAQACLEEIACVGRTAVSLGVRRIVTGSGGQPGATVPVQPEPARRGGGPGREPGVSG
jgi:hypothetical protein